MLNEQQLFVIETLVQDLKQAYRTQASDQGVDLRRLHDEVQRVLQLLDVEERSLRQHQVRVLRHLD